MKQRGLEPISLWAEIILNRLRTEAVLRDQQRSEEIDNADPCRETENNSEEPAPSRDLGIERNKKLGIEIPRVDHAISGRKLAGELNYV